MKNLILITLLGLGLNTVAATQDSFILRGKLDSFCQIDVTPTPKATALDLVNGEQQAVVAKVNAFGNDPSGLEIQIASEKGGKVVHETDDSQDFNYALRYMASIGNDNTSISLAQPSVFEKLDERNSYGSLEGAIDITMTGDANKAAGTYEDVVYLSCSLPGEGI